jgi:hypothetical protein
VCFKLPFQLLAMQNLLPTVASFSVILLFFMSRT